MEQDFDNTVSETEEEVDTDDGDTWSSGMMFCLPRRKESESSPRHLVTTKTRQLQPFPMIDKDMQCFLAKHFSFDDHDDKDINFFSSLPSLLRHDKNTSFDLINSQDYQLPFLRPMKRHRRKCRKRYLELEKITKLLHKTGHSTDTNVSWATSACRRRSHAAHDVDTAASTSLTSFPAGEEVDIGMTAFVNCTGTVIKKLSE